MKYLGIVAEQLLSYTSAGDLQSPLRLPLNESAEGDILKIFLALLLAAVAPCAFAQKSCDKAYTTLDMNACAKQELDLVEKKLNVKYQAVLKQLSQNAKDDPDSGEARTQLSLAQRQWIKFREADCQAIYTLWQSASIRSLMSLSCKQNRAEQRMEKLDEYLPQQ